MTSTPANPPKSALREIVDFHGTSHHSTAPSPPAGQAPLARHVENLGPFAGGVAHDLNNVFAPILMSIKLLKLRENDPRRLDIISIIEASARHGASLVDRIHHIARSIHGEPMLIQTSRLLEHISQTIGGTFPRNIHIQSHIPSDLWAVFGDSTQLQQVLMKLCVNALDAMPDGGTLTLTAENLKIDEHSAALDDDTRPGPYLFIRIRDNGCCIPPEIMERIFDPLLTTGESGAGRGLSSSLAIIKSHGGFIRVDSQPGVGTCLQVWLPAHFDTPPAGITGTASGFSMENDIPGESSS